MILSSIAVFFGIIAMIISQPYCCNLNSVNFIIAILSLLVTLLIGWNIFIALDFKKEVNDKIEKCRKEAKLDLFTHSKFNDKDFDNIIKALQRSESFVEKMDDVLFEHISQDNNFKKKKGE